MTKPLYAIAAQLQELFLELEETEGELTVEAEAFLNSSTEAFEEKLESIGRVIGELTRYREGLHTEVVRLHHLRDKADDRIEWLKDYAVRCMETAGIDKVRTEHYVFAVRENPPAVEVDWLKLPEQYIRQNVESVADKRLILDDIKGGATIPGAWLTRSKSVRIT